MPNSIGSTAVNKMKNRFANIIVCKYMRQMNNQLHMCEYVDDSNRVVLVPTGGYTNEYINASPVDVSDTILHAN